MAVVQSVDRAFRILDALRQGPASLSELARRVSLPISTTSRLLGTLEDVGAVERINDATLYRIGPSIVMLASGADASRSLAALASEELKTLATEANEAVGLSVSSGYFVHYIAEERPEIAVQLRDWLGSRLPMHLVSSGLVVLASWPDDALDNYLNRRLESPTEHSMTDTDALRERIGRIRADGVAWTIDELEIGISSVSAPLIARTGETVGGVNIHGPSYRFPGGRHEDFEKMVRAAAERINLLLS